jgi:hypothetical protein
VKKTSQGPQSEVAAQAQRRTESIPPVLAIRTLSSTVNGTAYVTSAKLCPPLVERVNRLAGALSGSCIRTSSAPRSNVSIAARWRSGSQWPSSFTT